MPKDPRRSDVFTNTEGSNTPEADNWSEYRRLILHELERINAGHNQLAKQLLELGQGVTQLGGLESSVKTLKERNEALQKEVNTLKTDMAVAKAQGAQWGAIGGVIASLVVTVVGGLVVAFIIGGNG